MNTQELAKAFTDMCAKGELEAAGKVLVRRHREP
jgi:hypothetical protein